MAQFDVHANPARESRARVPYLLDIQSDLLSGLATRVIVPLVPVAVHGPVKKRLEPEIEIAGKRLVMSTAELAALPLDALGAKVASLRSKSFEIVAAIDVLLSGI